MELIEFSITASSRTLALPLFVAFIHDGEPGTINIEDAEPLVTGSERTQVRVVVTILCLMFVWTVLVEVEP